MEGSIRSYEGLVCSVLGNNWRSLPSSEVQGGWGILIVCAVSDGCPASLGTIAGRLGVERRVIAQPFHNLSMNGCLLSYNLEKDKTLLDARDHRTWCYYAGVASGFLGNVSTSQRSFEKAK